MNKYKVLINKCEHSATQRLKIGQKVGNEECYEKFPSTLVFKVERQSKEKEIIHCSWMEIKPTNRHGYKQMLRHCALAFLNESNDTLNFYNLVNTLSIMYYLNNIYTYSDIRRLICLHIYINIFITLNKLTPPVKCGYSSQM